MNRPVRITLTIVALAVSIESSSALAGDRAPDPNAPTGIPAPETYEASWNSVEVRLGHTKTYARTLGAAGTAGEVRLAPQQSIAISGSLRFQDISNVIGVDLDSLIARRAFDAQGKEVKLKIARSLSWAATRDYTQLIYGSLQRTPFVPFIPGWGEGGVPGDAESLSAAGGNDVGGDISAPDANAPAVPTAAASLGFSVQLDLGVDQNVPASLSRVECQVHVLRAKSYLDVDVPFAASDQWHEPAPGVRIRVLEAFMAFSEHKFRTESRCDGAQMWCFPQSYPFEPARRPVLSIPIPSGRGIDHWLTGQPTSAAPFAPRTPTTTTPAYVLLDTQLLEADGIPYITWLTQELRNDYLDLAVHSEGVVSVYFPARAPATIRHVLAVQPYDVVIPVTLHDVAVPAR